MVRYPFNLNDEPGRAAFEAAVNRLADFCVANLTGDRRARCFGAEQVAFLDGDLVRVELPAGELLLTVPLADLLDAEPAEMRGMFVGEIPDDASALTPDEQPGDGPMP